MDSVNEKVLRGMQEYAQMYFGAIVEANTTEGEGCGLTPGRYSAKELANREKCPMGNYYALPLDEIYEEEVEITAGSFGMRFPYRRIFVILAQWEAMCRPGKFKTVFEVGAVEEKTAKVLTCDRTALGAFVAKRMRLRRIGGNWWAAPKEIRKKGQITGYYELNSVMFAPGKQFWGKIANSANQSFIANWDDAAMTKLITAFFSHEEAAKERRDYEYFREVATRVGIATNDTEERKPAATPTETPQISMETAETVNVSAEGEKAAERAENKPYYTHRWKVLHNCDLKTWDKFHKKHKEAILIFHHGTTYTALQKEAMKVSEMCDIAYKINRHGVEVCQFDDVTLDRIIEQEMYVAIAELPKAPDYGLTEPPQSPEAPPTAKHPTPPPILGRRRRKRARRGAQAAPGLRSAPGMRAGGCGASRHVWRRAASVTSHRCSVGISGMVHGGSFHRGALPRAGPPYT